MDRITAIAASGLRARMESLDLLANNAANASTGGYKADREFYSLYIAPEAEADGSVSTMPLIEKPWTDLSPGLLRETGSALDLAITGKGFFTVDSPNGPLYTRNGSFHLGPDGRLLTNEDYPVRNAQGGAFTLAGARPIDISADGTVSQDGQTVGKLALAEFPAATSLVKQGSTYFRSVDPTSNPIPATGTVHQGKLEASNTGPAETTVRLVSVMRQFEMLQKAVSMGGDMNRQTLEQVAKVGS